MWKFDLITKTWEQVHGLYKPDNPLESTSPVTVIKNMELNSRYNKFGVITNKAGNGLYKASKGAQHKSRFALNANESMGELPSVTKKKQSEIAQLNEFESLIPSSRKEVVTPTSTAMSNSIVFRSFAKSSIKDIYKGPIEKEEGEVAAKVPCPRDGHIAVMHNERMLVSVGIGAKYRLVISSST